MSIKKKKKKVLTLQTVSVTVQMRADECVGARMHWHADALACRFVGVRMCWRVDVLACGCVGVRMCWCADALVSRRG